MREFLREHATLFRRAIVEANKCGDIHNYNLRYFPTGCCTCASDLLQKYLAEKGVYTWFISGRYGYGKDGESHSWLELEDRTVIDITGDQYSYNKRLRFTQPIYVGPRNDGFHDKFELYSPVSYQDSINQLDSIQKQKRERMYNSIIKHIR